MIILSSILANVEARPQKDRLMDVYKHRGDELFFTLYWHPDSREILRKKIPVSASWVGFERGLWGKIPQDEKLALLEELGAELDRMEIEKRKKWWVRHRNWQLIHSQLTLLAEFLGPDADEGFVEFAFQDPTLRGGFQWILDRRGPNFDPQHVSATLAQGEAVMVFPRLSEHLLQIPEKKRIECFSRVLARIAERKPARAEQGGEHQSTPRSESKSE